MNCSNRQITSDVLQPLEDARNALAEYSKTNKMPIIPEEKENENFRYDVWKCVFQKHLDVWEYINIIEQKRSSTTSAIFLKESLSENSKVNQWAINITAKLCHIIITKYNESELDTGNFDNKEQKEEWKILFRRLQPKIFCIWLEACGKFDGFIDALRAANIRHNMFSPKSANTFEEMLNKYGYSAEDKIKTIVDKIKKSLIDEGNNPYLLSTAISEYKLTQEEQIKIINLLALS